MDTLFTYLKKSLVAMMFVVVGFAMTYVPQVPTSNVHEAEAAAAAAGISTWVGQTIQNASTLAGNAINSVTAGAVSSDWFKNNVLDGIGWAIAKRIISGIVQSLIQWVNSGFAGRPAFIQDFKGFMLNIADEEIGRVINDLGGIGSFICSPFRLDVQISVALQYSQGREQQSAPTCTLTGIIDNIEGFISGIDPGNGLSDWLTITSQPQVYTPYGAALSAQANARARIINAQGEERTILGFGDGFQSQKICRSVSGFTGSQDCSIVKPGQVIAAQLNKALGAGQDSLVEADEINELVAALLGQLANQALTGVAGLLGLSGGDGFGGYSAGPSYLDDLVNESNELVGNAGGSGEVISDAIATEVAFETDALEIRQAFVNYLSESTLTETEIAQANAVVADIDANLLAISDNIIDLVTLETEYTSATAEEKVDLLIEFTRLNLNSPVEISDAINNWKAAATDLDIELD